jgi:ubiquinone/menaquinone biosynthesis C-methylase UbiE
MKANKNYSKLILGSIFNMPVPDNSYDGIYNLGVMEHFSEEEIKQILKEFNRILKPSRKIVLFWPPEFGLSVMFLKLLHFILNHLFKKSISLHPPEISRVKSRSQVERLLNQAEFTLNRYAFGIRDLFTYVVIVGEKNS